MPPVPDRFQDLASFRQPTGFRGRSAWIIALWWLVQALPFAWSPQPFYAWRAFLLRCFGARIGRHVRIRPSVRITYPWNLTLGDHVWVGDRAELYALGPIKLGHHVVISQGAYLCGGSHDPDRVTFDIFGRAIVVEDEVLDRRACFCHARHHHWAWRRCRCRRFGDARS